MALTPASVEDQYRKNPNLNKESVDHIVDWMGKQPHLPKISELEIILFLHSCLYSIEKTKYTIETYYTVRTHVPEFFSKRDPNHETLVNAINTITFFILPEMTNKGERVIYCRLHDAEPSHFIFANVLKYFIAVTDLMLHEYGTDVGHRIVIDMKEVVIGHLTRLTVMPLKKFLFYLQEAMPIRLRGMHFMNAVPFMDKILALMRPFMKPELMNMIFIHTTDQMDTFFEYVPKSIMIKDYGGNAPDLKTLHNKNIEKVKTNCEFLIKEEKFRVNESLRQGKAKNAGDLFGVEGSFKKLDID